MLHLHLSPLLLLLFILSSYLVTSELVLEPGYSVSTLIDFNKYKPLTNIHPFSILPRRRSDAALILLDSSVSAFYSLLIPTTQESEVSLFSGKGVAGFSDGDKTTAMFDKPRSFAIDGNDNVYVADRIHGSGGIHGVIRKIDPSGVTTTIAGGYSEKPGHIDGSAQNASFSNDVDLVYIPNICALLISDRGNRLIRQLELKPEDCAQKTKAGLGVAPISGIAVLCLLFGLILGFIARPFFSRHEISSNRFVHKTWKHYQTNLGRLLLTAFSGSRSAVANSTLSQLVLKLVNLSQCYLSVVFRNIRIEKRVQCDMKKTPFKESSVCSEPVSLLDSDVIHLGPYKQEFLADQLQDLINVDIGMTALEVNRSSEQKYDSCRKIEDMINANLLDFSSQPREQQVQGSTAYPACLIQRRATIGGGS